MSPLNAEPGFGNTPLQFGVPLRHAIAPAQWHPSQLLEVAKSTGASLHHCYGERSEELWDDRNLEEVRQMMKRSVSEGSADLAEIYDNANQLFFQWPRRLVVD